MHITVREVSDRLRFNVQQYKWTQRTFLYSDFLPLVDVNEWNINDVQSVRHLTRTFLCGSLVHIDQRKHIFYHVKQLIQEGAFPTIHKTK